MIKLVEKILKLLPFDGSKTKLGALLALWGMLRNLVPDLDWVLVLEFVKSHPTPLGIVVFVLGILHRELKKKAPTVPEV